jgi:hypothetical protein
MSISKIGGAGGFDRGIERLRAQDKADKAPGARRSPEGAEGADTASISTTSRETLQAVDGLTERVRQEDPDREARVAAAAERLEGGELDDPAVYRAVAERLLRNGF